MLNDPLANALSSILNAENSGKTKVDIKPVSKVVKKVLEIMNRDQYLGDFTETDDSKGGFLTVNLLGKINQCRAIKPRFAIKTIKYESFEKQYLPAQGFGMLIVSTPQGIMTNQEAKKKGIGGKLIAYCY